MIGERLKTERNRLGFSQEDFAALAGVTRRPYAEWEAGKTSPTAVQLAAMQAAGADVQYIITGDRQGHGIGESGVHQAVLDAIDLFSLDKKVNALQLARAVVKLCARESTQPTPPPAKVKKQVNVSAAGGQAAGRNIVNKRGKS